MDALDFTADQRLKARIVALTTARDLRSPMFGSADVIAIAKDFERYLLTGDLLDEKSGKAATPPTARA